jgi:hypothetical protein
LERREGEARELQIMGNDFSLDEGEEIFQVVKPLTPRRANKT